MLVKQLNPFAEDVQKGLSANPKAISSRYFYDEIGDVLFQKIMYMPEYYPTRTEHAILSESKEAILEKMGTEPFDLIEFGAGDAYKTKILLKYFQEQKASFDYMPIDISGHILEDLELQLEKELPGLSVNPVQGEYFHALNQIHENRNRRKLVLFLGSNIGNLTNEEALEFLGRMYDGLQEGDFLLLGIDLKKDPKIILEAYNDSTGITSDFNLNVLKRMNKELGANFDLDAFYHYPVYDPSTATAKSFLISKKNQEVFLKSLGKSFSFTEGEEIATEISQKYDVLGMKEWADLLGLSVKDVFTDSRNYFADILFEK